MVKAVLNVALGEIDIPAIANQIITVFGAEIEAEVKKRAPVDYGYLRDHWRAEWPVQNYTLVIGTNAFYAALLTRGTGIYGPYKTPICAKGWRTGNPALPQALAFKWRKMGNKLMIRRCVRGIKPNPYVQDGIRAGSTIAVRALKDMAERGDI